MKFFTLWFSVLMLVFTLIGCWPIKLTARCQQRIDACLKSCGQAGSVGHAPGQMPYSSYGRDFRSGCEQHCQNLCKK